MSRSHLRALVRLLVVLGTLLLASSAAAEPIRILVAAGNKNGLAEERPLKFADNDARHVRDVMMALGGVKMEHAFYLAEPTRAALYDAIDKAKAVAAKHDAAEVTLVFYFSGHGDREAIHLAGERVLVRDLATKLGEVPAALRIAVTDACRATREKGFAADEPFAISATLLPQASGQVAQTIEDTGHVDQTKHAFAFGPEATLAARFHVSSAFFVDLSANGLVSFVSEEHVLTGLFGGTGAVALGVRF